jgi:oligopeptidase B
MPTPQSPQALSAPRAAKKPVTVTHHGVTLTDDYAWLRAPNWQDVMRDPSVLDPEIRAYLDAENAYMEAAMAGTTALQDTLFKEMKARIKEDDSSVPSPDGAWDYYSTTITGGQYARICRRPRGGGKETILIDGNREAEGKPYWSMGATAHSHDHRLLAYSIDDKGSELYTIHVRDMATGRDLADAITDTRGAIVWALDNATLFYVRLDENQRPTSVYRHTIGTPASEDVLVYEDPDPGFYVGAGSTQSSKFIIVGSHDHQTSESWLIDADAPTSKPRLVEARKTGHEYSVEHATIPGAGDVLIITTNSNDAEDFRICTAPAAHPGQANWRELIAHKPGRLILEAGVLKNHMVRLEREDGLPRIVIHRLADQAEHSISFDEEAYGLGLSTGYEFDTTTIRFTYSSMTTPAQVFDYDVETRIRTLRKTQEVPSGHVITDYVTRRLFAPAKDGELVPVTLLYKKSTPLDGTAPVFLYGYGSYGISMPAGFSTTRLSLVDRGFIFALAHIRGGKDKGYRWYTGGKHKTKLNTFNDFIAAGEFLVAKGLTRRGRIVANGGSAGGMLMGACANMAPDLFLGIIADVPFVDVLNTMLDKDLPLTPPEWPEWGNPLESAEDFALIKSYSPYDNVEAKAYPAIFAYGGLTDPRVTYWEPAKWVAKLREMKTDGNLLVLKTNMSAGHGGASGRFEALKEIAVDYAFAIKVAGKLDVKV